MKLLHICKVFCEAGVEARIAITVHIVVVVDRMLYSILGDGVRKRASLFSLVSEEKSIVGTCKQGLLELLEGWGNDGDHVSWELLRSSGGDFGNNIQRSYARREILQSCCCTLEHFELRLSRPPYTILKLMDDAVSDDQKHEVAEDFLNKTPDHCHCLFGKRVKLRCPTIQDLLEEGPHIARALDQGVDIAIDYSERSHGDIRKDVRSSGPARSFTVSANRHYCHEAAAAHRSRPGAQDPLVPLPSASSSSGQCLALLDDGGLKKQKKVNDRRGGSAQFEYNNSQLNAFKAFRASDRKLTDAEIIHVRERCKQGWERLPAAEKNQWDMVHVASVEGRIQARVADRADIFQGPPKPFQPLWKACGSGSGSFPDQPLPPSAIMDAHRSKLKKRT
jgi:hypothetical protein